MNYKALHIKARERFLYICLSYTLYFVCPIIKTQTMCVGGGVRPCFRQLVTERDPCIARGRKEGSLLGWKVGRRQRR